MIINPKNYLKYARKSRFAIGHFNAGNLESAIAIILAAEEQNAPVFLALTDKTYQLLGLEINKSLVELAKNSAAPIALHYDHGSNFKIAKKNILDGFKSIMFDGSNLKIEDNIKQSRKYSQLCHQHNVCFESELGLVGGVDKNPVNTDLNLVKEFCQKTKTDSLAICIGNKHKTGNDKLDFNLLEKINNYSPVPLVLHGASSMPLEKIKKLIENGICKINIDTDLKNSFTKGLVQYLKNHPEENDYRKIISFASLKIKKLVEYKIGIFGSKNKA